MTVPPTNGPAPYRVSYPTGTTARLRRWAEIARDLGVGAEFLATVKEMDQRLHYAPTGLGEAQFNWHGMNVTQFLWCSPFLVVHFAVHKVHPVVMVREIRLTPGSGIEEADTAP